MIAENFSKIWVTRCVFLTAIQGSGNSKIILYKSRDMYDAFGVIALWLVTTGDNFDYHSCRRTVNYAVRYKTSDTWSMTISTT